MTTMENTFRVIIAGSRTFDDYPLLAMTMDHLLQNVKSPIAVICGMARGADSLGEKYAAEKGYEIRRFPANWNKYGKQAGYIRNQEMAENADALVAFWDGNSRGTQHMVQCALKKGLRIRIKKIG